MQGLYAPPGAQAHPATNSPDLAYRQGRSDPVPMTSPGSTCLEKWPRCTTLAGPPLGSWSLKRSQRPMTQR